MTCEREGVYVERRLARGASLTIHGEAYAIDFVGQDDGLRPVFRFVLQLGQGYMIYLWVVGQRPDGFFHSFWTKDCAVAEVDLEEHGPPGRVRCARLELPRLYEAVVVEGAQRAIERVTFEAEIDRDVRRVEARWTLAGGEALTWSGDAWRLDGRDVGRVAFG